MLAAAAWAASLGAEPGPGVVGLPAAGDEVRYRWTGPGGEGEFWFRWLGAASRPDRFGAPRDVDVAEGLARGPGEERAFEVAFRPGHVAPMSLTERRTVSFEEAQPGVRSAYVEELDVRRFAVGGALEGCLVRAGWQGLPVEDIAGQPLAAACPAAQPGGEERLQPGGPERAGDIAARAFRARLPPALGGGAFSVALAPGLAYPVRLAAELPEGAWSWELAGLRPGEGAAPLAPRPLEPEPARRPGLGFGEPGTWGIVEGDPAAYPFPPSAAAASLEANPALAEFHAYRAAHPSARVVAYRYFEERHDYLGSEGAWPTWWFLFNEERGEGFAVEARRPPAGSLGGSPVGGGVLPLLHGLPEGRGEALALPPLEASALPREVVRADHAIALWGASAGHRAPVNAISATLQPGLRGADPPLPGEPGWRGRWIDDLGEPGRDLFVGHVVYGMDVALGDPRDPSMDTAITMRGLLLELATGATVREFGDYLGGSHRLDALAARELPAPAAAEPARPGSGVEGIVVSAAGGLTAAALLLYALRSALEGVPRFLGVPLYARLGRRRVLEHPVRAGVLACVQAKPGIATPELERHMACSRGALRHHLGVLARGGLVRRVDHGGRARWFPAGALRPDEMLRRAALASGSLERAYRAVLAEPGLSQEALARRLGVTPPAVHYQVAKLEGLGLVRRLRDGRRAALYASGPRR